MGENTAPIQSADLSGIIERLQNATGPDREIDAQIWLATTPGATRNSLEVKSSKNLWPPYTIDETRDAGGRLIIVPAVTASVDAAIALAERIVALEGRKLICFFCAGGQLTPYNADQGSPDYHPKAKIDNSVTAGWMAHVAFYNKDGTSVGCRDYCHGRTAALAICLATFRALQSKGEA